MKTKLRRTVGFTLVELLIVVAVIAILASIAIPAYGSQMERSREAVDRSNLETAKNLSVTDYMVEWATDPSFGGGDLTYYLVKSGTENGMSIQADPTVSGVVDHIEPQAAANSGKHIEVVVRDGGYIVSADWVT